MQLSSFYAVISHMTKSRHASEDNLTLEDEARSENNKRTHPPCGRDERVK